MGEAQGLGAALGRLRAEDERREGAAPNACHPEHPGQSAGLPEVRCGDSMTTGAPAKPIAWIDGEISGYELSMPTNPVVLVEHGGFLSGAQRKWGADDPRGQQVQTLGVDHGVDENVQ